MSFINLSKYIPESLMEILYQKCPSYHTLNFKEKHESSRYKSMKGVKLEIDDLKDQDPNTLVYIYSTPRDILNASLNKNGEIGDLSVKKTICFGTANSCYDVVNNYHQDEIVPHYYLMESFSDGLADFKCME